MVSNAVRRVNKRFVLISTAISTPQMHSPPLRVEDDSRSVRTASGPRPVPGRSCLMAEGLDLIDEVRRHLTLRLSLRRAPSRAAAICRGRSFVAWKPFRGATTEKQ